MQIGGEPLKFVLMIDLTKYNQRCVVGQRGVTIPDVKLSMWGDYDRFVAVKFDNGASMDVLWDSIQIIKK